MIWEYKTLSLPCSAQRQDMLSEMGLSGWELIGFEQGLAYFKRPKPITLEPKPTMLSAQIEQKPSKKK